MLVKHTLQPGQTGRIDWAVVLEINDPSLSLFQHLLGQTWRTMEIGTPLPDDQCRNGQGTSEGWSGHSRDYGDRSVWPVVSCPPGPEIIINPGVIDGPNLS